MIGEMEPNKNIRKYHVIYIIFGILVLFAAIIGVSTALYNWNYASKNANVMDAANISMSLLESTDVIDITNSLPIPDSEGILLDENSSFDFAVTTNIEDEEGNIKYTISISRVEPTDGYMALANSNIKLYLTYLDNGKEIQVMAPTLVSNIIESGTNGILPIDSDKTNYLVHSHNASELVKTSKFRLRMWIDDNTEAGLWDENTKLEYKLKINVSGIFSK